MDHELSQLNAAAARGEKGAYEALIQHYLPDLHAFVRLRAGPLVRARESTSDLVQSVCRELLEHREQFRFPGESAFRHWLFTNALRKIQNRREHWLRDKRDVLREVPLAAAAGARDATGADGYANELALRYRTFSTPSRQAMAREEVEQLEAAFDQLPEDYREVITLAYLVGLSRAEIGERLQRSEAAVRVLLHRALARLARLLGEPRSP